MATIPIAVILACVLAYSAPSTAAGQEAAGQEAFNDRATCKAKDGEMLLQAAFALRIDAACQVRSEYQLVMTRLRKEADPEELAEAGRQSRVEQADSLRATLVYDFDVRFVTPTTAQDLDSCEDGSATALALTPAHLVSKRVVATFDGTKEEDIDVSEVPLFGDEATRAIIMLSPEKAQTLTTTITAVRQRCEAIAPIRAEPRRLKRTRAPAPSLADSPQAPESTPSPPDPGAIAARANVHMVKALKLRDEIIGPSKPMTGLGFYMGRARITDAISYHEQLGLALNTADEALDAGATTGSLNVVRQGVHYLTKRGLPHRVKVALFDSDSQVLENDAVMRQVRALKERLP